MDTAARRKETSKQLVLAFRAACKNKPPPPHQAAKTRTAGQPITDASTSHAKQPHPSAGLQQGSSSYFDIQALLQHGIPHANAQGIALSASSAATVAATTDFYSTAFSSGVLVQDERPAGRAATEGTSSCPSSSSSKRPMLVSNADVRVAVFHAVEKRFLELVAAVENNNGELLGDVDITGTDHTGSSSGPVLNEQDISTLCLAFGKEQSVLEHKLSEKNGMGTALRPAKIVKHQPFWEGVSKFLAGHFRRQHLSCSRNVANSDTTSEFFTPQGLALTLNGLSKYYQQWETVHGKQHDKGSGLKRICTLLDPFTKKCLETKCLQFAFADTRTTGSACVSAGTLYRRAAPRNHRTDAKNAFSQAHLAMICNAWVHLEFSLDNFVRFAESIFTFNRCSDKASWGSTCAGQRKNEDFNACSPTNWSFKTTCVVLNACCKLLFPNSLDLDATVVHSDSADDGYNNTSGGCTINSASASTSMLCSSNKKALLDLRENISQFLTTEYINRRLCDELRLLPADYRGSCRLAESEGKRHADEFSEQHIAMFLHALARFQIDIGNNNKNNSPATNKIAMELLADRYWKIFCETCGLEGENEEKDGNQVAGADHQPPTTSGADINPCFDHEDTRNKSPVRLRLAAANGRQPDHVDGLQISHGFCTVALALARSGMFDPRFHDAAYFLTRKFRKNTGGCHAQMRQELEPVRLHLYFQEPQHLVNYVFAQQLARSLRGRGRDGNDANYDYPASSARTTDFFLADLGRREMLAQEQLSRPCGATSADNRRAQHAPEAEHEQQLAPAWLSVQGKSQILSSLFSAFHFSESRSTTAPGRMKKTAASNSCHWTTRLLPNWPFHSLRFFAGLLEDNVSPGPEAARSNISPSLSGSFQAPTNSSTFQAEVAETICRIKSTCSSTSAQSEDSFSSIKNMFLLKEAQVAFYFVDILLQRPGCFSEQA
ncbi:unnamed protein product [Amoebophrya sp. A120]|nr:unnamed protein product [Amoebophrya sp. A120]|eukprot:GSA120T00009715001.1